MKKRIVSFFLVLAMCAALLPTIALADDVTVLTQADFSDDRPEGSPVTVLYGCYVLPSGSYKLEGEQITLNRTIQIPDDAAVTLDLNGCTLLRPGDGDSAAISMDYIYNGELGKNVGGTLTLEDSSAGQTGKISGGTIHVEFACTFVMNGGTICNADIGVLNYGVFTMNGGKITDCETIIQNDSTVELKEGTTLAGTVENAGEFPFDGITFMGSVKNAGTDHPIDGGIFHADADTVVENGFSYDACPIAGKITGGIFYSAVKNYAESYSGNAKLSIIEGGIFYGTVTNESIYTSRDGDTGAMISGGVFYGEVINKNKNKEAITGGVFLGETEGINFNEIEKAHEVTCDLGDGSGAKTRYIVGDTFPALGTPPAREGYTFDGWYKGADYKTKWNFEDSNTAEDGLAFYAKWTEILQEPEEISGLPFAGLLSGMLTGAANNLEETFADVSRGAYYYNAVEWAHNKGIAGGVDKKHFAPDESCTRAQAVTMLWRAAGCPAVWTENPFEDVDADDYYYEAVLWAVANGITSGADETHFSPDAPCTRGQIVTFLHRAARCYDAHENFGFVDVKTGSYCEDAVNWAVENAITNGTDVATFSPDETCTRSQIVTFLYRNR